MVKIFIFYEVGEQVVFIIIKISFALSFQVLRCTAAFPKNDVYMILVSIFAIDSIGMGTSSLGSSLAFSHDRFGASMWGKGYKNEYDYQNICFIVKHIDQVHASMFTVFFFLNMSTIGILLQYYLMKCITTRRLFLGATLF